MAYRAAGGTPCPRCKRPMVNDVGELSCIDGCGTWIENSLLARMLVVETLAKVSRGNPFRVAPLPPIRCLVCKTPMNDIYQGDKEPIALGQCVEHGVWVEGADRETFMRRYGLAVHDKPVVPPPPPEPELHEDPIVADLIKRVRALEAEVEELKRRR